MSAAQLLPTTERALLHRLATEQSKNRAPSMVAGVIRDGQLVWNGARGKVNGETPTPDTQYRIGSITKTFIAVMVLRLRDEGKVKLNTPFETYVSGTPFGELTIAQLLSHTSGITSEATGSWWERIAGSSWPELAETIGTSEFKHRPGRRFHYSNLGFGALGELVGRLRGVSWFDAVRSEILQPLEMMRTAQQPTKPHAEGWAVHPWADVLLPEPAHDAGAMAPAGQLWSTLTDLARWCRFVGGDTADVLSGDTIAEMREPIVVEDGDNWTSGYGLGLELTRDRGRRLAGHTGSMPGFLATVWIQPEETTGAVVFANTTSGVGISAIATDLIDILAAKEPRLPAEWTPLASNDLSEFDKDLLALTGTWYWGPMPRTLRLESNGWLSLHAPTATSRASRFKPASDGTWVGLDGYYAGETLRIVRRADDSISHLDLATFVFTRTPYDPQADIPGGVDPEGWRPVSP